MIAIKEQTESAVDTYAFPATAAQRTFWYLDRLHPGNPAYNIALRFRLTGPLKPATLAQALSEVARRHEALRTTMTEEDGELLQVVSAAGLAQIPVDDMSGAPDSARLDALMAEEARRPFDLQSGPLLRGRLLRVAELEHILLLTVHHIISDGWSTGVILNELVRLYDAFSEDQPSALSEPPLQFADFAIWQSEWLNSPAAAAHLEYWKRQFADFEPVFVPHDKQASGAVSGHIEAVVLPRALTDALVKLSTENHATLFITCLACLKLLLSLRTSRDDITVGTLTAGRSRTELEPVVGLFVNTLVLRTSLSGDPTFLEVLDRVRETYTGAIAHQDLPFGTLVEEIRLKRNNNRNPWFGVNFIFQRAFLQPQTAGGVSFTPIPSLSPGAILDLNFGMVERAEGWRLSCEYSPEEYERSTIRDLLESLHAVLQDVVADPARRVSSFQVAKAAPSVPTPLADARGSVTRFEPTAARDETEQRLAEVWREVLRVPDVTATDDFFDLGGHSLTAARLVARIRDRFGVQLSPAVIHEHPTVHKLAKILNRATGAAAQTAAATNGSGPGSVRAQKNSSVQRAWEPLYFPSSEGGKLYGVHTRPTVDGRQGVVLCSPVGHEYMTTYRCLRLLAANLAEAGFHVLRFDYSGMGNSSGSFEQASVSRWVRDIGDAVRELYDRSGVSDITLIGLRLGAALAYRSTQNAAIHHLVLWDPVADGREYLRRLRVLHAKVCLTQSNANAEEELLGYSYPVQLIRELEKLDLTGTKPQCDRVSLVLAEDSPGAGQLRDYVRDIRHEICEVNGEGVWDDQRYDRSLHLHEARRAILDILGRASS